MPIYNPYNNQNDYYNPYENTQQPTSNVGEALFNTAKTMVVMGALNTVSHMAWSAFSKKSTSLIAKYGKGKLADKAAKAGSLGGILKDTSAGRTLNTMYKDSTAKFRSALDNRSRYLSSVSKTQGPAAASAARFTSAFKDTTTFAGTVGRLWKNKVLQGAGVAYAVDSFFGFTQDMGLEKKALWDIPGQVGNFGKWLAYDSVYSLGFSASTRALKAAGGGGTLGLKKAFSGKLGDSLLRGLSQVQPGMPVGFKNQNIFNKQVLSFANSNGQQHFISKAVRAGRAIAGSVPEMIGSLNNLVSESGTNIKDAWRTQPTLRQRFKKGVIDPTQKALRQIKDIWKQKNLNRKQYNPVDHPGLRMLEFVDKFSERVAGGAGAYASFEQSSLKNFIDVLSPLNKKLDKPNALEQIFPSLRPMRNRDMVSEDWVRRTSGNLKSLYPKEHVDDFMKQVLNMRAGLRTYRAPGSKIVGGGVDLGFTDPLRILRRTSAAFLSKPFRVGFTGMEISLGDLVGANIHMSESPNFEFFEGNTHFDIGNKARKMASDSSYTLFDRTTGYSGDEPWFTTYVDGKLAFINENGINTIDWGRKLKFAAPNATWRKNEQHAMNRAGYAASAQIGKLKTMPSSTFGQFIHKSGLELPGLAQRFANTISDALQGKNKRYKLAAGVFESDNPHEWYRYSNYIKSIRDHTGQELIDLFKNKEALSIIADANHASQFGDAFDVMVNSRSLRQRLESMQQVNLADGKDWAKWLNKRGIREEVDLLSTYPNIAEGHTATKKIGRFRKLNVYDKVRVEVIEDVFNEWAGGYTAGSGKNHPILAALPELKRRGYVNSRQEKALRLRAKLNSFIDTGVFGDGFRPHKDDTFSDMLSIARRENNSHLGDIQRDIVEYIGQSKVRNPNLRSLADFTSEVPRIMSNTSPYVSVARDSFGYAHEYTRNVFDSVTGMLNDTVFPFRKDPIKHFGVRGNLRYVGGAVAKTAAGIYAFKVLDAAIAANPLFDDTSLEDGIGPFVGENVARGRLFQSRAFDALGITGVAKHLNGLLPGFTTSAPGAMVGAVVSRTLGGGPLEMAKWFAGGAIANRMLAPYLPDFTKDYDQLSAEYKGQMEVPIMKSPTWLLGGTPWEGSKVIGYQPNWYVRSKSRWQESDTLYGSTFRRLIHEPLPLIGVNIGDFIDPYYMERKHYFSRPYPLTGRFGEEVPLIGPLIAATLGKIIKPEKTMHQRFLETGGEEYNEVAEQTYPFANPPPTLHEGLGMMKHTKGLRKMGGRSTLYGTFQYGTNKYWAHSAGEDFINNIQNFAGLPGFLGETISNRLMDKPVVMPTLETAGRIASQSRAFFDANLGGMGIFTEPIRRLINKPDYKRHGINPIPNLLPNWLPEEFLTGDPYAKIIKGELRLPGEAYNRTHTDIRRSMPARASMFGAPEEHMVQYFTGMLPPMLKEEYDIVNTGTAFHEKIQNHLAAEGLLLEAERLVYDAKRDISGHVDGIIRDGLGGGGRKALEIKTISAKGFQKLDAPKDQHVGQLNFYLKNLNLRKGTILYVNRENPAQVKTYDISYSESRWKRDIQKLNKVRQVSADLMGEGLNDNYGYSYSWVDRLNILADVAPTSKEFKEAKKLVQDQIKFGILSEREIEKYNKALQHRQTRLRKYELFPTRFKGKVFSPDTERNIQSINEDIKAAAEYSLPERAIGSLWENFTNSNNFISNKFFAFKDPLEHYKMTRLYGKEYKPWDEIWSSFAEPTMRGMTAQTDPIGGAYRFGMTGYILGGNAIGALGAAIGSAYGTVHGLFRTATNSAYIPGIVKEQREIETYFDQAKYERFSRLASLSEGFTRQEYISAQDATLTAFNQNGQSVANLFRATPYMEKPYIEPWLNIRNEKERKEVLKYIPDSLGKALQRQWRKNDESNNTSEFVRKSSEFISQGGQRQAFDRSVLDPSVELDDIKLKTIEDAGLNGHDYGLGWNNQLLRMESVDNQIAAARINARENPNLMGPSLSPEQVRLSIQQIISEFGLKGRVNVYINEGANDVNSVDVSVRRDRTQSVMDALLRRKRYMGG